MKWTTTPPMRTRCRAQTGSDRPDLFPGNGERCVPVGRHIAACGGQVWRLFFQNRTNGIGRRVAAKGTAAAEHFIEHRAEAKQVRARVNSDSGELLGRHVTKRTQQYAA